MQHFKAQRKKGQKKIISFLSSKSYKNLTIPYNYEFRKQEIINCILYDQIKTKIMKKIKRKEQKKKRVLICFWPEGN